VITTNFDRLLEKALEAKGITPTVISTADAALGAIPLTHSKATIIKINGDYLDTRIRNTSEELSVYEPQITVLIDRVFDEFGLLVCGWSADWDLGLCASIEKTPNRRFTTFWCLRGEPTDSAKSLIALRSASVLKITGADSLFERLKEKVYSLRELSNEHPLSSALAIQSVKRYLPNPQEEIRLHDLVMQEVEKVIAQCTPTSFPFDTTFSEENFRKRVAQYEAITEIMQSVFATGCYWGAHSQIPLWIRALQRLANPVPQWRRGFYYEIWRQLSYYPGLLLFYCGGIAAIAAKKYDTFAALAWQPLIRRLTTNAPTPLAELINAERFLPQAEAQAFNPGEKLKTPTSQHLFVTLRPRFSQLLLDHEEFQRAFDEFEYFVCLSVMHRSRKDGKIRSFALGSFVWRGASSELLDQLSRDADTLGVDWPPLKAGLFDGSPEAFRAVRDVLHSSDIFNQMGF
jgi:hypothetical protein